MVQKLIQELKLCKLYSWQPDICINFFIAEVLQFLTNATSLLFYLVSFRMIWILKVSIEIPRKYFFEPFNFVITYFPKCNILSVILSVYNNLCRNQKFPRSLHSWKWDLFTILPFCFALLWVFLSESFV